MADSPENSTPETAPGSSGDAEYRVLARKYRPSNFDELIGQDVLVRTLTNAIRLNRVHHAFILTGVRGIGKTTTARSIARALNCIGPDGRGGPTIEPCGVCEPCIAIAEDRHPDILEIDAASNTGVDNVRDIIESVRYSPVSARYKIYIIDEVHMLSTQAFNALLKTLEEPPEHVKFVFATTEIRKVPVTVLSRCQRFDLRRLDEDELAAHLKDIAGREQAAVADDAIAVLARAADGSVRDGLSLLDQVIAQSETTGGDVSADQVRTLLGMADRSQSLDLFETVMGGDASAAIDQAGKMYRAGAAPLPIVQDLMDITHWMTRLKLTPGAEASGSGASHTDAARAAAMAGKLQMGTLTRSWQMLMKGINEIQLAPQPMTALEMLLVRLCYVTELPTPGDLVARLEKAGIDTTGAAPPPATPADTSPTNGAAAASTPDAEDFSAQKTGGQKTGTHEMGAHEAGAHEAGATVTAGTPSVQAQKQDPPGGDAPPQSPVTARAVGDGLDHDVAFDPLREQSMGHLEPVSDADFLLEPAAATEDDPTDPALADPASADPGLSDPGLSDPEATGPVPTGPVAPPANFRDLVNLFRDRKQMVLFGQLYNDVHMVSYDIGRLEIRPEPGARRELASKVAGLLKDWTEVRWIVTVSSDAGAPTLREQDTAAQKQLLDDAAGDPLVRAVLDTFEGSELTTILEPVTASPQAIPAAPSGEDTGKPASDGETA